jgi:hypothetical protein
MPELGDFDGLPDDICLHIFSFLDTNSKLSLSSTSKKGHRLINESKLLSELQHQRREFGRNLWNAPCLVEGKRAYLKIPLGVFVMTSAREIIKTRVKPRHNVIGVILVNPDEPLSMLNREQAVAHAQVMVKGLLATCRIALDRDIWPVCFPNATTWSQKVNSSLPTSQKGNPDYIRFTEGLTPPKTSTSSDENIYMNPSGYFTTGSIVHEMFHSLQHPDADSVWNGGEDGCEAMTELYTLLATGLDLRVSRSGGFIYPGARALKHALQANKFSLEELHQAYFFGDEKLLRKLDEIRAAGVESFKKDDAKVVETTGVRSFLKQSDYSK